VNVTWFPTAAVVGTATLVNAKSDCPAVPTITLVCVKLFDATGSLVSAPTRAVFVNIVPLETPLLTLVTIVNVELAPEASDVAMQEIVPVDPTAGVVQLHPVGTVID
jgi:hypothetical protein